MNNSNNNIKKTIQTKQTKLTTQLKEKEIKRPPPIITNLK
jgi:hypothetical protein